MYSRLHNLETYYGLILNIFHDYAIHRHIRDYVIQKFENVFQIT